MFQTLSHLSPIRPRPTSTDKARQSQHFKRYDSHIVADPTSSLRTGDIVRIIPGYHSSKTIKHVVAEIVAPWGEPIDERPRLLPVAEILKAREEKKAEQRSRRIERKQPGGKASSSSSGRGKGKSVDEVRSEQVRRIGKLQDKSLENEARGEALQAELDGKGIREEDVRRRLEGVNL
ncbi:MAG: hypothetical protein MMC33_001678 [Icmadophila ericetorum]|nr:hypothetical protein [Icmadophila ericetorum]